jgi:hypothetical protein
MEMFRFFHPSAHVFEDLFHVPAYLRRLWMQVFHSFRPSADVFEDLIPPFALCAEALDGSVPLFRPSADAFRSSLPRTYRPADRVQVANASARSRASGISSS